jgi:hypothetical protein
MNKGFEMIDPKAALGVILTSTAAASTWIEQANAYGQLLLTAGGIVVAILKLRNERKDKE